LKTASKTILSLSLTAILAASLTGCGTANSSTSEEPQETVQSGNPDLIMKAFTAEFPECVFEKVEIPSGEISNDSEMFLPSSLSWDFREVDFPDGGISLGDAGIDDSYWVCNTKGSTFAEFEATYFESPETPVCGLYLDSNEDVERTRELLQVCEELQEQNSSLGFWIIVKEFESEESLTAQIVPLLEKTWKYAYRAPPFAHIGNVGFTANGHFDYVSEAVIESFDLGWKRVIDQLGPKTGSQYVDQYPESFKRENWSKMNDYNANGNRIEINRVIQDLARYSACDSNLEITELDFTLGECGKAPVEVFQADLATGECHFLGYWLDENNNQRVGVFEFCSVYREGSFTENSHYRLKVRASGVTSYQTRLGYEKSVVSFTVVGSY
jgi:hypothetical protein